MVSKKPDTNSSVHPGRLRLAVRLSSNLGSDTLLKGAKLAEEIGFDRCWFADNPYERSALVTVAAVSQVTSRIGLGVGTVSVRTRHPMMLAQDAMAVAAYCEGRFTLGLGTGIESHRATLGLRKAGGLGLMENTVAQLRQLFKGDQLAFEGGDSSEAGLQFGTIGLPIFIGAVGPRSLDLTGRIADGVIFSNGCNLAYLKRAIGLIVDAATEAGRGDVPFERVAYIIYGGSVDRAEANRRLKTVVGYYVEHMAVMFIGSPMGDEAAALARALRSGGSAQELVTDEMVDGTSVWGDPERCVAQLQIYQELGIDEVALSIGDWLPDPVKGIRDAAAVVDLWSQKSVHA